MKFRFVTSVSNQPAAVRRGEAHGVSVTRSRKKPRSFLRGFGYLLSRCYSGYSSMSSVLTFFTFLVGRMISRRISSTTRIAGEMNIDRFTVNVNPRSR